MPQGGNYGRPRLVERNQNLVGLFSVIATVGEYLTKKEPGRTEAQAHQYRTS